MLFLVHHRSLARFKDGALKLFNTLRSKDAIYCVLILNHYEELPPSTATKFANQIYFKLNYHSLMSEKDNFDDAGHLGNVYLYS